MPKLMFDQDPDLPYKVGDLVEIYDESDIDSFRKFRQRPLKVTKIRPSKVTRSGIWVEVTSTDGRPPKKFGLDADWFRPYIDVSKGKK